jgi:hypothetical protein
LFFEVLAERRRSRKYVFLKSRTSGILLWSMTLVPLGVCAVLLLLLLERRAGDLQHPVSALARIVAARYR